MNFTHILTAKNMHIIQTDLMIKNFTPFKIKSSQLPLKLI